MSNELKGGDFVLYIKIGVEYYPVACSNNVTVSTTADKIELAPYINGVWRKFIYGRLSGTISGSGVAKISTGTTLYGIYDIMEKQHAQQTVLVKYTVTDDAYKTVTYAATCLIDEITITGQVGQFMTFNFSLTINGMPEQELYLIADNLDINIIDNGGNLVMYNNQQFSDFMSADFEAADFNI